MYFYIRNQENCIIMETNDKHLFKRGGTNSNNNGLGFALILILVGAVYLCLNLGIIPMAYKTILISWQMLLIVIGLWSILKGTYTAAAILILIGGIFIYPKLHFLFPDYFEYINIDFRTYWPVILIAIGLILIIGKAFPSAKPEQKHDYKNDYNCTSENGAFGNASYNLADFIDKNIMFGSSEQIVLSPNFRGGEGNVMFGELVIDLRRARMVEGSNFLELNAMFGSVILYVPSDWNVEIKSNTLLGSFEDKRYQTSTPIGSISRLTIKGSAMFGSGEIRN